MRKVCLSFGFLSYFFCISSVSAINVTGLKALYKNGQVFVTWTNLKVTGVKYNLYKSTSEILYGKQLHSCRNMGYVPDNSGLNERLTMLDGNSQLYFKTDSASSAL